MQTPLPGTQPPTPTAIPPPAEFPNYDTFLDSLIATFAILNLDNLEVDMMALVRAAGWGAPLFFFAWVLLGQFIVLSLFLAITLETFEAK